MLIKSVTATPFDLVRRQAIRTRTMQGARSQHVLITISTDDGIAGNAEALAKPTIYGETQQSIVAIVRDHIAPRLVGIDPLETQEALERVRSVPANNSAKAAVDIALHDLVGRLAGLPLHRYWGGSRTRQAVSWTLGIRPPKEIADEAEMIRAQCGIEAFKVKGGVDPADDLEAVRLLRERLGPTAQISLDPNEGYSPWTAARVLEKMADYDLAYVEEPIPHRQSRARALLARQIPMPILGDDSCFTLDDVVREVELGAVGMVSIKTPRTGFDESFRILTLAESFGLTCVVGTAVGGGLSSLAALQFACARSSLAGPSENSFGMNLVEDVIEAPTPTEGHLAAPSAPGLGADIIQERVDRLTADVWR